MAISGRLSVIVRIRFSQELEHSNQVCGFGDIDVHHLLSVLVEDGALWVLEENVVERVAASRLSITALARSSSISFASQ